MKLSHKILVPVTLLIVASIGAIYLTVLRMGASLERERSYALLAAASNIQATMDRNLFERYGDVQAFGLNTVAHRDLTNLGEAERAELTTVINNYVKAYGCYVYSFITEPGGRIVAINTVDATDRPLAGITDQLGRSVATTPWFRAVSSGQFTTGKAADGSALLSGTVVTDPAVDELANALYGAKAPAWTMTFTAPIRDNRGNLVGYWHNAFNASMLEEIVASTYRTIKNQELGSAELSVIDRHGNLVIDVDPTETGYEHTRPDDLFKVNFLSTNESAAIAAAKPGSPYSAVVSGRNERMSRSAGTDFIQVGGYARSVPTLGYVGSGFTTFVRAEPAEAFRVAHTLKNTVLIVGVVALALAMALMYFLVRHLVRSVNHVKAAIVALSQGNLSQAIQVSGRDEVAEMARACNATSEGLKRHFKADQVDWIQISELRVQSEMVNQTSIISVSDLKGDIVWCNDKFTEVSQYSREELIGKPHSKVRHPDMAKEVFKELWSTIGRGQTFRGVVKNRKKDGTPYYVDAVIAPVLGDNGKPVKYIGIRYDITASEVERQNAKAILDAINTNYAYIEFDTKGIVQLANDNFLKTLGYTLDEIKGRHHRIFVDPAISGTPTYAQFWADLNAGKSNSDVFKRINKEGKEVWIQAVYAPVLDEVGRVTKIVKIATDITAAKVESTNNDRQLAETNRNQLVIEFDAQGAILTANDNFLRSYGYSLGEIKGQHHRILLDSAQSASAAYGQLWNDLNAGKFITAEYRTVGKGGHEVWIQATYNPRVDVTGKVTRIVLLASDITPRKHAEASLKQTLEAVTTHSQTVASAAEELSATAKQMTEASTASSEQSDVVAAGSEQVSKNVGTVATAAEEMNATIKEIARNAAESARVATAAVKAATDTNTTVTKLGESSNEIGEVIKVITSIAQQTNLLALNATIEAARAGEAGKGFAVVANEVKELARQTAAATEDISRKIEAIQTDTKGAVTAIGDISRIIGQINDIQSTIASAVEEQSATTNEIARNASEAAAGSADMAKNITGISQATRATTEGARNTLSAAQELSKLAADLKAIVDRSHSSGSTQRPPDRVAA
ncbi:Biofilm dispersion protein BdlA [Lacunisphaera limnophila]|uniref:Biofilm dispersion protein BdlA n=1 Tax=Lacunisphaera limnophila TaxID=1838286 RepID=A0A1D8AXK3_9BACT|nr:PAS domain-containing protein [Lacunisphaera limnophila]AOS45616.1 Biofilm dispersion protein BdlA [Lacunisphaera limnophila]